MVFMQESKKLLKYVLINLILFFCIFFIYKIEKKLFLTRFIVYPISCDKKHPYWINNLLSNFQKNGYVGVQLSFQNNRGDIVNCSVGWASLFPPRRMKNSDQIMYASISKVFTSALILKANREKKLSLDELLVNILEIPRESENNINKISIKFLMQHKAGFDRNKSGDIVFNLPNFCPNDLKDINIIKLDYEPGEGFSYSNFGYCLLGEVIRKTYDDELIDIYQKKIFFPAHAKISHVKDTQGTVKYFYTKNDIPLKKQILNENFTAYGGFVGSAYNYAKVIKFVLKNDYIKNEMMDYKDDCAMHEFYNCHGLAFYTYKEKEKKIAYWRDGSLPGVSSFFMLLEDGSFLVILANSRNQDPKQDHIDMGKKIYKILQ